MRIQFHKEDLDKDLEKIEKAFKDMKIDEGKYLELILLHRICLLLWKDVCNY